MNKAQTLFNKAVEAAQRLQSTPDAQLELARARIAGQFGVVDADYPAFCGTFANVRESLTQLANSKTASELAEEAGKAVKS